MYSKYALFFGCLTVLQELFNAKTHLVTLSMSIMCFVTLTEVFTVLYFYMDMLVLLEFSIFLIQEQA